MNAPLATQPLSNHAPQLDSTFAHFLINITREIGAVERLLGTVRRRGFEVESIMATQAGSGDSETGYRIELRLQRHDSHLLSFETLARQIARNLDVLSVSMMSSTAVL